MTDQINSGPTKLSTDNNVRAVLKLIQQSYAYMDDRIDPPSSMHRLTTESIAKQAQEQEVWVLTDGGNVVGCVFLSLKPHAVYVGKLAVAQSHRRQGLAAVLVNKAEERAHSEGLYLLELESRIELTEIHAAFETMGFEKISESSHKGYDNPTYITMQKKLTAV